MSKLTVKEKHDYFCLELNIKKKVKGYSEALKTFYTGYIVNGFVFVEMHKDGPLYVFQENTEWKKEVEESDILVYCSFLFQQIIHISGWKFDVNQIIKKGVEASKSTLFKKVAYPQIIM